MVPYGDEFWNHRSLSQKARAHDAPFDLTMVMDRVRHAVRAEQGNSGWVRGERFSVDFGETVTWSVSGDWGETRRSMVREGSDAENGAGREIVLRSSLGSQPARPDASRGSVPSGDSWVFKGNTAQRRMDESATVIEHYQALERGLEITWIFAAGGDARNGVSLEALNGGLAPAETAGSNVVFRDSGGEFVATLESLGGMDATGGEVPVDFRVAEDGQLVFRIASSVSESKGSVAIRGLLSPPFDLSRPVVTPTTYYENSPAIAMGAEGFLAVWENGTLLESISGGPFALGATRLSRDGEVLDVGGFGVGSAVATKREPAVAANNRNFLVVWQDIREGRWQLYASWLGWEGNYLLQTAEEFQLTDGAADHVHPALTATDEGFLAVWEETNDEDADIVGARLSGANLILPFDVSRAPGAQTNPAIASRDGECLIVWETRAGGESRIMGRRIDTMGNPLSAQPFFISPEVASASQPAVASVASGWLVAWETEGPEGFDIHVAPVHENDTVGDEWLIAEEVEDERHPSLASSGDRFFLAWERHGEAVGVFGRRVNADGGPAEPPLTIAAGAMDPPGPFVGPLDRQSPFVASTGSGFLVAWTHGSSGLGLPSQDIHGCFVPEKPGTPLSDPIVMSVEANQTRLPRIATNGENFLIAWPDDRIGATRTGGEEGVFAARVSPAGEILDPEGIEIRASVEDFQWPPRVASNGRDYLLIWSDSRNFSTTGFDVYGARITGNGTLLDPGGIAISRQPFSASMILDVAGSGNVYLVVIAQDMDNGGQTSSPDSDIHGVRVLSDGTVLDDPPIVIDADPDVTSINPKVASDGEDFFVVWSRVGGGFAVYGRRVLADGSLPEDSPILITDGGQAHRVESNGENYLVTWSGSHAQRFTPAGQPLDDEPFSLAENVSSAIGTDGTDYFLVWASSRNSVPPAINVDIYGGIVTGDGDVLIPEGIQIAGGTVPQANPDVAWLDGRWLVAYSEWNPASNGTRVRARFVDLDSSRAWANHEIGTVGLPGGATVDSGVVTIKGSGAGFTGESIGFHFLEQEVSGNASITARLVALPNEMGEETAGVMLRTDGSDTDSAFALMAVDANGNLQFSQRPNSSGTVHLRGMGTVRTPVWLRLVRLDGHVIGYTSEEGLVWEPADFAEVLMPSAARIGFAIASGNERQVSTALFDNMLVSEHPPPRGGERTVPRLYVSWQPRPSADNESGASVNVLVAGRIHSDYLIEYSEDLSTWHGLAVGETGEFGATVLTDLVQAAGVSRFYRISWPPLDESPLAVE